MFGLFKKKLVLQFASRRGGSTILAQILSSEPNVGFIDQPFDLWKPNTKRGQIIAEHIPAKDMSQFFELEQNEKKKVELYMKKMYQHKLLDLSTNPNAKQFILKIVNAHGLIDVLPKMAPSVSIVLLRHPCSQASSVVRNGWGTCEKPFLNSETWSKKYLSSEQKEFGNFVSENGTYFAKAVLNWCLEWHYPLNFSNKNFLQLYYEELVTEPEIFVKNLYAYIGYKNVEKAIKMALKPSGSSNFSTSDTLNNINDGNRSALLSSWRKYVSEKDLQDAQEILDVFKIKIYSAFEDSPIHRN